MQPYLFFGGLIVFATLIMLAVKQFHEKDESMAEMLADNKRTDQLIEEAMQRYPAESEMIALTKYRMDNLHFIQVLKSNDGSADVIEGLKFALRDQRLMTQELHRLFRIEIHNESQFNKLTAAQA